MGYLSWAGIVMVIIGTVALFLGPNAAWMLAMVYGGFALAVAGALLNGLSERRSMSLVDARCVDVEMQFMSGIHMQRSAGYAVRALMRYPFGDREYEAPPGRFGYEILGTREAAEAFVAYLKTAAAVPLYVDPEHPTRVLFKRLVPPRSVAQTSKAPR